MKKIALAMICLISSLDLVASERLKNIIMNAPSDNFVIQIASIPENGNLEKAVKENKLPKRLVAIKTKVKNENRWVLLEGIYKNQDEAEYAAKRLEASNARIKPWVRSIASLKQVLAIRSLSD